MADENGNNSGDNLEEELDESFDFVPYEAVYLVADDERMEEFYDEETENMPPPPPPGETPPPEDDESHQIISFDEEVPARHSYLGDNLEALSGRTIHMEGSIVSIPLLTVTEGTLVPGQTFPLVARDHTPCALLRACIQTDRTFGHVAKRISGLRSSGRPNHWFFGSTCEIYEFSDVAGVVTIKAKARQRFKLLKTTQVEGGYLMGEVRILPEIKLSKPLLSFAIPSLSKVRRIRENSVSLRQAYTSPWPKFVYDQYDEDKLKERISRELSFLKQGLRKDKNREPMPNDPCELSYWLASHLDAEERLFVLQLNSHVRRLRWQLSLMSKFQIYHCGTCEAAIARQKDVFAMSTDGFQGTYVNPGGFIHDTMTVLSAQNLMLVSRPSTEYSWFPGYAWSIAVCDTCHKHIGWKFAAQRHRLYPAKFWGLSRLALVTRLTAEEEDKHVSPIM